jgi:short-subunit dehydrogenase
MAGYYSAPYAVTKHTVVALSECLYIELEQRKAPVKVSVLCTGNVKTNIASAERNRPVGLQNEPVKMPPQGQTLRELMKAVKAGIETGMSPLRVADKVFEAIKEERFYILTHPEFTPLIQLKVDSLLSGDNPRNAQDTIMKLFKLDG